MKLITLVFMISIWTSVAVFAQVDVRINRIDSMAAIPVREGKIAGMSIAVAKGKTILLSRQYGFADLEFTVPTPAHAVYEIGSISKQFTATAILRLEEMGKFSLDDDIEKLLPQFHFKESGVTVRHLLHHTSGIKDYLRSVPRVIETILTQTLPRDTLIRLVEQLDFEFKPGEAMSYSNSGYVLLGLLIEKYSGQSYREYIEQQVLQPAGMGKACVCNDLAVIKNKTHGYAVENNTLVQAPYWSPHWKYADGGICATAEDLVAWNQALHKGKLLSPAVYRNLITPGKLKDGILLRYGMGLRTWNWYGHRVIEHGGGTSGFTTLLLYYPDEDLSVAILINSRGGYTSLSLSDEIASLFLPNLSPAPVKFYSGSADNLTGVYAGKNRFGPFDISIEKNGNTLQYQSSTRTEKLIYTGGNNGSHQTDFSFSHLNLKKIGCGTAQSMATFSCKKTHK